MSVTADRKEEIHLHVYDIKFDVEPGKKVTKSFTADKSGEFPIEIEDTSKELGSLTVKG
jgi:copper(I)-binding protein